MGTTDLYAGIDIRTGKVITSLAQTHATPDFLRLMNKVVAAYDGQKVHVVLDNASVHLSKDTGEWLAKQRGRVVFHFTPTGTSWMNQIEIWNACHHPEGDPVRHVQLCEGAQQGDRVVCRALEQRLCAHRMDTTADEILDKVRVVTSHMEALLRATEIDDVAGRAA